LSDLKNGGNEIALVSSGAISVGTAKLGLAERPSSTRGKQAAAAVGQCELMNIYQKFFGEYGYIAAQMLLTRDVFDDERRLSHAENALSAIFEYNAIPVINENDSVSVIEIEFGDNDTLSAYAAKLCGADLLVMLTDIDGLFDRDPKDPKAKLIAEVTEISSELEQVAKGAGTSRGTGGMVTKLQAARVAMDAGIGVVIINGNNIKRIYDIIGGERVGTYFKPC
jgi:glutamate 5-kinase